MPPQVSRKPQHEFDYIRGSPLKMPYTLEKRATGPKHVCHKVVSVLLLLVLLASCGSGGHDFVRLEGKQFTLHKAPFFPVMVNYVVDFVATDDGPALSPTLWYENPHEYEYLDPQGLAQQVDAHLQTIAGMGFNTVRLCFDRVGFDDEGPHYTLHNGDKLYVDRDLESIHHVLEQFLNAASRHNLKVMLLIKAPHQHDKLGIYTRATLRRFRNTPTIFAYDFYNEPLYFDPMKFHKNEAYWAVWQWKRWMIQDAPYQLLTIGFAEPIEVFRWDPEVLPVDFVSFHTYQPLRIPNEIYWYSKYTSKPWMLGETSLPADNDSISYEAQRQLMRETWRQVKACGGSGFAWWEFQDEPILIYDAAFNGLLNNTGTTEVEGNSHRIQGTVKPAGQELRKLLDETDHGPCNCAVNYHNMVGYRNLLIRGKVVDKSTGEGIEGALVRGWNEWWDVGMNTFTDSTGHFTLYSNDECVHFEISAPGMTMIKFDGEYTYRPTGANAPPMDQLADRKLEYQKIQFQPFLASDSIPESITTDDFMFNFDPSMFSHAYYEADAGTFKISKFKPGRIKPFQHK